MSPELQWAIMAWLVATFITSVAAAFRVGRVKGQWESDIRDIKKDTKEAKELFIKEVGLMRQEMEMVKSNQLKIYRVIPPKAFDEGQMLQTTDDCDSWRGKCPGSKSTEDALKHLANNIKELIELERQDSARARLAMTTIISRIKDEALKEPNKDREDVLKSLLP